MGTFLENTWDLLLKGGMAILGFFLGMLGGDNYSIKLLLVLMVTDYLAGVIAGLLQKSPKTAKGGLSSRAGAKGLLKKALMLLVILVAYALDRFVDDGTMFQGAVTWFYISNEGLSLIENLGHCGVPIPKKLKVALEQLAEENPAVDMALSGAGRAASGNAADEGIGGNSGSVNASGSVSGASTNHASGAEWDGDNG